MNYSEEQQHIIDLCKTGHNIIVDAVAGSGKTTTLLGIGSLQNLTLGVLYNKSLKEETRLRAAEIPQLEVHTYHALARKYYDNTITNDNGIIAILKSNKSPLKRLPHWSRLVIDEVQDMTPLYFKLIRKLIADLKNPDLRLTVMGDRFQSIYSYMGADPRFLTHADKIYTSVKGTWATAKLSISFRCSPKICQFINEAVLGYDRMMPPDFKKQEDSPDVYYIHGSPFDAHRLLVQYITTFLQNGYRPESIFVLTTSVKVKGRDTPTRVLENALVSLQIPVYVPNDETTELSEGTTHGKLIITTFHQSKGLEREIVILYNFDNSYYYNKDYDANILASPLYVGLTRAKKYLFLVHDSKQPALQFYNSPRSACVKYMTTHGTLMDSLPHYTISKQEKKPPSRVFTASELTNYLSAEILLEALTYINLHTIRKPTKKIPLPAFVSTSETTKESVSDINGIGIPALYELRISKNTKMSIAQLDDYTLSRQPQAFVERYKLLTARITSGVEPPMPVILELANIFSAVFSGYHYKVAQIKSYLWLNTQMAEPCLQILSENILADDTQYEVHLPEQITNGACIRGQADAYSEDQSTLWEIKCTETLDNTHLIQLAAYMWLFSRYKPDKYTETNFHLLNIRTDELIQLTATSESLDSMMAYLVLEKTRPLPKKTDTEFIKEFTTKFETSYKQLSILNMLNPSVNTDEPMNTIVDQPTAAISIQMPPFNPNGRVIVFDLETNGLPESPKFGEYYPPSELNRYRTARVVQWSWALYEPDGTLIKEEDHLITPNTAEYRIMNSEIHGITEAMAKANGKPFETVLALWKDSVDKATTLVGHNVNFDKYVLLSELHRRNFLPEANTLTSDKTWICTMDRAKALCGLKARNKLKPPKLCELMHALGIDEEKGRTFHNSRDDVYYTARCYFAEQVLKNPCPKMYEGKYAGKTYEAILSLDRAYAVHAAAVCKVRKLYSSPLRKLSNWVTLRAKTDPILKAEIAQKEQEIRNMSAIQYQS
jgi:DNA polymerase III epsilon subunit-like protein